ncbi:MAG TPA: phytanoyl-CoA dioxygenase family protein [Geminicoccaceae bacterium]|nr:phytanoyl-CoA dioxygenase family protein [Geminicoccaceae bacterium]
MRLTDHQTRQFEEEGYLFLPSVFSGDEVAALMREVPAILAQDRPEVVREKDGATPRTAFAVHTYNELFGRLARHPRLIEPVEQLLGGQVYIHQFKINAKAAFDGDVWQWHQDYGTWKRDDDMPEARAMNIALFLVDVTEFNGPLMFIPKSHKRGVLEAGHDVTTTSYPLWTLDHDTIRALVEDGGLVAPKGPAGSVLMFHSNLVHGSPSNLSPWHRTIVYISACHVDNHIRAFKRPAWIAHRDFTPVACLPDDCLLQPAAA